MNGSPANEPPQVNKDLKAKSIRGGTARVCALAANFVLRLGSMMVLARLLEPTDFGLIGMVTAFTGVLMLFRDFGLSSATVQWATVTEEQISTLFWINVLIGAILTVLAIVLAPVVAAFTGNRGSSVYVLSVPLGFLFNAAGVQHSALFQRQMRFTALAVIEIVSWVVGTIVGWQRNPATDIGRW